MKGFMKKMAFIIVLLIAAFEFTNAQTSLDITASTDTEIWTRRMNDNYGRCNKIYLNRENNQRGLIQFNLSSIPSNATILSASLRLVKNGGNNEAFNLSVHRITNSWTEGSGGCSDGTNGNATWNNRTTGTAWGTAGGDFNSIAEATVSVSGNAAYTWDIKDLVQNWVNGTHANNGLLIKFVTEGGSNKEKDFASRETTTATNRPRLIVEYSLPLSVTINITNVSCFGGNNGSLTTNVTGGSSPYTYNWGSGITTSGRTGLSAGSYTVTVTDALGATATANATVNQPAAALLGSVTVNQQISCFGNNNGSVTANANGGMPPYTYSWSGGATTASRTGLSAGTYTVTITDNAGCSITASNTLTQPAVLQSSVIINQQESSLGSNDGSITASATGGTTPYTYNWGNGATTADITGLSIGTYTVTVTDNAGCTTTANNTIMPTNTVIWVGTSNKDWRRAANWSNNKVPTETDNVYIPNGTPHRPEIGKDETFSVNSIYFDSLARLAFDDKDSRLNVKGNFYVNHCGFGFDEGRVYFNGAVAQHIYAPCKIQFERLYIENTSNTGVYLFGASVQVNHELYLRDGYLYTNDDTLIVARTDADNSIKEFNEDESHVVGYLNRYLSKNNKTYAFPVGKGSSTSSFLISVKNNNMEGISQLTARFRDLDADSNDIRNTLNQLSISEDGYTYNKLCSEGMWTIEPNIQPTSGSYNIIADLKNFTSLATIEFGILKKPTGSGITNWGTGNGVKANNIHSVPELIGGLGGVLRDVLKHSKAQRNSLTSFSDFGVGGNEGGAGLPIQLINFIGKYNAQTKAVDLNWNTAAEINNEVFVIQRSEDGESFTDIISVKGAGNSSAILNYTASDTNPLKGISYYRLKQVDYDGQFSYSSLISVNNFTEIVSAREELRLFPNPSNGIIKLFLPTSHNQVDISIIDWKGNVVKSITATNDSPTFYLNLDLRNELMPGSYLVKVSTADFSSVKKLQIINSINN